MVEYFYVVDEEDNVIGKATREECHRNRLVHRSVYVFVLNDKDGLFLQKRSMSKDLYPGYYTGSATGHVDYGEDYESTAHRELREELGINESLKKLFKFKSFSKEEREISVLYLCRHNGPFSLSAEEIEEGMFMNLKEIKKDLKTGEKKFANGFKVAFNKFLKTQDGKLAYSRTIFH